MKLSVVFDTNILISALFFHGKQRQILEHAISQDINLIISEPILEELSAVLSRHKFAIKKELIYITVSEIIEISKIVYPKNLIDVIKVDPDDNRILECALEGHADYIISGNKHLLDLEIYEGIKIINTVKFIEILRKSV